MAISGHENPTTLMRRHPSADAVAVLMPAHDPDQDT
jgi:hypothetical protein